MRRQGGAIGLLARLAVSKGAWLTRRSVSFHNPFGQRCLQTPVRSLSWTATDRLPLQWTAAPPVSGVFISHVRALQTQSLEEDGKEMNSGINRHVGSDKHSIANNTAAAGKTVSALSAGSARSREESRAVHSRHATRQMKKLGGEERDKFFNELQRSGKADVYHYSAMLSHVANSEQADSLLMQMAEAGVRPNIVTYNTLISKHQASGQLDRANALLERYADVDSQDTYMHVRRTNSHACTHANRQKTPHLTTTNCFYLRYMLDRSIHASVRRMDLHVGFDVGD